ncbi:Polyadenylate-binding protein 1-A [Bagarius yarrelli]|uniref:Polyadenylate-binding protein 1-A n=1 Tax=Bagarius yarrelli TaxID=175774 RepID=A0A556TKZ2_BAGYA|nr:Polyadenylate-binding protein 1-A [Bagarius yarrelli]
MEMNKQEWFAPSFQPHQYDESITAQTERTLDQNSTKIMFQNSNNGEGKISFDEDLESGIKSPPEPVSLPGLVYLPDTVSVFLPKTVAPPVPMSTLETLPSTEQILINNDRLLGRRPESLYETVPLPEPGYPLKTVSSLDPIFVPPPEPVLSPESLTKTKQTMIKGQDPKNGGQTINIDKLLRSQKVASPLRPVCLSEPLPESVPLPEPVSFPKTVTPFMPESESPTVPVSSPESLAKTKQTLIRIRDPSKGNREISIEELLGKRITSLSESVSLPDFVSPPEALTKTGWRWNIFEDPIEGGREISIDELFGKGFTSPEPMFWSETVSSPEAMTKTEQTRITVQDSNEGGRRSSLESVFQPVCVPEHVSPLGFVYPPETESQSNPEAMPQTESTFEPSSQLWTMSTFEPESLLWTGCPFKPVSSTETLSSFESVSPQKNMSAFKSWSPTRNMSSPDPVITAFSPKPVSVPESKALDKMEQTLITIQDYNENGQEMTTDEILRRRRMSPPKAVSLPEHMSPLEFVYPSDTDSQFDLASPPCIESSSEPLSPLWTMSSLEPFSLPETLSPFKSMFLPETMSPFMSVSPVDTMSSPEPVSKTVCPDIQKTIRIEDPSKGNQKISIEELLERSITSSSEPVSLPEFVSYPEALAKMAWTWDPSKGDRKISNDKLPGRRMSSPGPPSETVGETEQTQIRIRDPSQGGRVINIEELLAKPFALPETVSPTQHHTSYKTMSLLKTVVPARHVTPPASLPETLTKPLSPPVPGVQLFIRNLDYSIKRQRLYKEFLPFGDLISAKLPENFPIVPGTNPSHFVFVPVPVYVYVPMYYPSQPPGFNPQHPMIEISEQGCSIPSTQPPQYDEPNAADQEQTLIQILDPDEESLGISVGQLPEDRITLHPDSVPPSETLPMFASPAESVSVAQPLTVISPEPLTKTEQTTIRIQDTDELLRSKVMSPPQPVSLSESLPETLSSPNPVSVLHSETVFPTDPVSRHELLANLKQTLIRIRDPNKGGREINIDELLERRAASPPRPVSLPECLHETVFFPECLHESLPNIVSPPEPMSSPESLAKTKRTLIRIRDPNEGGREISIEELLERRVKSPLEPMSLPESSCKTVSLPEPGSLPEPVSLPKTMPNPVFPPESLPKTVSPHETAYVPKAVSLPNTMISTGPVSLLESLPEYMSPPEPVFSTKALSPTDPALPQSVFVTLPETVSLPESVSSSNLVSLPGTMSPPKPTSPPGLALSSDPLANTIRTPIKIRDPQKCGKKINTGELLEKRESSPPRPVSLPEFLHDTVSSPETMSPLEPVSLPETVLLPEIVSSPKTVSPLDFLSVFANESIPETVFPPVPVSSPKSVSPFDSVSPAEPMSPPEPLSSTKQTLEKNQKSPVIRIWVSNDRDREINIDEPLERRVTSSPESVSPPKSQSKNMSPPEPAPNTESVPNTVFPPDPVYAPPKPMSPPKPGSPPKPSANTERTLIRIWVSSDDGQKISTNEFLGRRVFSPPETVSPTKSLPETVSSPGPVAQAKYLSSLKTEPDSLPKTMSLPKTVFLSSTKTVSSHGPVSSSLPKIMSKPKHESKPEAVFLSEPVYLPLSPPKLLSKTVSLPRTVSPPKPVSNMSRRRTLTPVPLMWGDIMDALDAEQEEKKLREKQKDDKFTEPREKVKRYRLSTKSRNLVPHTTHSKHTKGVELSIRGMDLTIDKQRLYKEFLPFGDVISAKVIMKNGLSKGYGFVVYSTQMDAEAAIREMNGKVVGEKPLVVALTPKMKSKR